MLSIHISDDCVRGSRGLGVSCFAEGHGYGGTSSNDRVCSAEG